MRCTTTACSLFLLWLTTTAFGAGPGPFTRLVALPPPRITAAATEYPGGRFGPENLLDGDSDTAYATAGKGTATFVEFDFGKPVALGGFQFTDRQDPATVARSLLTFGDPNGAALRTVAITHRNRPGGRTSIAFSAPITAQHVRWQVTRLGNTYTTVGGAEIVFYAAGPTAGSPSPLSLDVRVSPLVRRTLEGGRQTLDVAVDYPFHRPIDAELVVDEGEPQVLPLTFGRCRTQFEISAIEDARTVALTLKFEGKSIAARTVALSQARKMTIYLLPHSHTDIGYTQLQTEIEDKQVDNLLRGMAIARETATYPPGARFVWNVEVLWAADLYLKRMSAADRERFYDSVRSGQVHLCGMYLNELTGLCRPEELLELFQFAAELGHQTGRPIESAMISDVPGYTWGTVTAMAQAGIRYFSVAPNYFDRVGDILVEWENRPFYWQGPCARDKVLVWIPFRGYATSHIYRKLSREFVEQFQGELEKADYPYEIAYLRWSGHGDNAVPDGSICEFVKQWNGDYVWPQFRISGVTEAFRALEERYEARIPTVRGDWTPYWEDGAGSSAAETALNRNSSDRMVQAAALWAMQSPESYPKADFRAAWKNVMLYSEHTWGAWCSVSQPNRRETLDQWRIKQSYARTADRQSRSLLSRALALNAVGKVGRSIDVFNTTSWSRTELVVVPKHLGDGISGVADDQGKALPAQRLTSGELAFLATDVPPLTARRYSLESQSASDFTPVTVSPTTLDNGRLRVSIDSTTGAIVELARNGFDHNLVDLDSGQAVNDYLYFNSSDAGKARRNGPVNVEIGERGPLIASLIVSSDAPGCHKLVREICLVAGTDYLVVRNLVDKRRLVASDYHSEEGKESVNFAFPFNVPAGQIRLQTPLGVVRPDADQIPSACKNWFTVGRWADVSNEEFGVTWVSLDAPLVQVGGLTANLLNSQSDPSVWRKQVGPTQKFYSWVMNNHWGTNYRAYQEGPVLFRYCLWPHGPYNATAASKRAIGLSQPLLVTAAGRGSIDPPLVLASAENVLVTGIRPSADGKAVMVRLWESSGRDSTTDLHWSRPIRSQYMSDLGELPISRLENAVKVPGWGVVTIRTERE